MKISLSSLQRTQLASIQRAIARWESLTHRVVIPGEHYQVLLAHFYARTPIGALALDEGSDFAMLLDALRHFGTPEERITHLRALIERAPIDISGALGAASAAHPGGLALWHSDPAHLSDELIAQLATGVSNINNQIGSAPLVRLQLELAPFLHTCQQLLRPARTTLRDDALILATDTLGLAARLAFETRDDQASDALYRQATAAASRLRDRRSRAAIHTSHAMVTLHATGNLKHAGQLAQAAVTAANANSSYALLGRAHAVHAEVCARAGQARHAYQALELAWTSIDQLPDRTPGFNAQRLDGFDGLCALHLGNASHAHDRLEQSLTALGAPRDAVQRGIVSSDLALARLRLGDPEACTTLLHEAIDLAATTGGRVPAQRIRHVRTALRQVTNTAELDDHIHDRLIGR
ncbi:hypothetical protein AB0L13_46165 [Saccharopolyspora shandongensis]|uniref:hypothetical protein n=1 Tax=Saccharopolyspora shandongensis TaxID=418495 RepID=UPI00341E2E9D